jgi:hypothetical protein
MKLNTSYNISFSKLLDELLKNGGNFLCHCAEEIIYDLNSEVTAHWPKVSSKQTYDELRRIMPNHIRHLEHDQVVTRTLNNWTKNMPDSVQLLIDLGTLLSFRVEFLTWAIEKFGDQEITFYVECTEYDSLRRSPIED